MNKEILIIYLHDDEFAKPSWVIVDPDGKIRQYAIRDDAAGLMQIAYDKQVIVIVPATDVLLTTTILPKMSQSRLQQALPYALEEQLITDVENLHFAIALKQSNDELAVAVVAHEKMQQWLALLHDWGIQADSLVPASLALPWHVDSCTVAMSEQVLVRNGEYHGFICEFENLIAMLNVSLAEHKQIVVKNYSLQTITLPSNIPVEQKTAEQFILDCALQVAQEIPINLLQNKYNARKSSFKINNIIRAFSFLGAILGMIIFLYPAVSYFILKNRLNQIDEQMRIIYHRQFPQSTTIIAPKLRMEEKLHDLQGQANQNRFLILATQVGYAMQKVISIKLQQLNFQNNWLTLELTAANPADFSQFANLLISAGLSVKQQNANLQDSHVNTTIIVE